MITADLPLHPQTQQLIDQYLLRPSHALALVGPSGSNKTALVRALSSSLLSDGSSLQKNNPYLLELEPDDKGTLSIDVVRRLQKHMSLKTIGTGPVRRIVIIHEATALSLPAQNALLKLLEEPPADSVLLLTVSDRLRLLPTVRSRLQWIDILPISSEQATQTYAAQFDAAAITTAHHLSEGRAGLLLALLQDSDQHQLKVAISSAKQLYGQTTFERLTQIDGLAKDKPAMLALLAAMKQIARVSLASASVANNRVAAGQWHSRMSVLQNTEALLRKNANPKLALTDLFLHL